MLVALLALVALSCGGSDDDKGATPAPGDATPSATREPEGPAGSASVGSTPGVPGESITAARLSKLTTYSYAVTLQGVGGTNATAFSGLFTTPTAAGRAYKYEFGGLFVAPNKAIRVIRLGPTETTETIIGDKKWQTAQGQRSGPSPAKEDEAANLSTAAGLWDLSGLVENFGAFVCEKEVQTINKVPTHRCTVSDAESFRLLHSRLKGYYNAAYMKSTSGGGFEVFLSDDGYPVRLHFILAGKDTRDADFQLEILLNLVELNANVDVQPPR